MSSGVRGDTEAPEQCTDVHVFLSSKTRIAGKEEDMTTHFDPKEGRPVKYPGEDEYPAKASDEPIVSRTENRHLDRGQKVLFIFVAIMVAVLLIWGGTEWLVGTPGG